MSDTIFALATPPGRGAVAVVRLSGPGSRGAMEALIGRLPAARRASLRRVKGPGGDALDEAIVLWMPGPASYTGEDSAELHLHGGLAVVEAVSGALSGLGLRLAEPGEFTRRAFEHGRLDLAQAEAVADLVDAETGAQRAQALRQLDGALSGRYGGWRMAMVEALAILEAAVDFPDEDLPEALGQQVRPRLAALHAELTAALSDAARGERVRDGFRMALIGAPNAGKSSLLNGLAGRDLAIVTAAPGTTRDIIETPLGLGGYKVVLADMAGLRAAQDPVEAEGVRRARLWAQGADLRLWVIDGSASDGGWREAAGLVRADDLCLLNKADAPQGADAPAAARAAEALGAAVLTVSATADGGLDGLRARLAAEVGRRLAGADFPAATRERHRARLESAVDHLARAGAALDVGAELAAEDLRLAARALAQVSGRVDAEQVLDVVFASFCIGK